MNESRAYTTLSNKPLKITEKTERHTDYGTSQIFGLVFLMMMMIWIYFLVKWFRKKYIFYLS